MPDLPVGLRLRALVDWYVCICLWFLSAANYGQMVHPMITGIGFVIHPCTQVYFVQILLLVVG